MTEPPSLSLALTSFRKPGPNGIVGVTSSPAKNIRLVYESLCFRCDTEYLLWEIDPQ
jgi:hypothetical protein